MYQRCFDEFQRAQQTAEPGEEKPKSNKLGATTLNAGKSLSLSSVKGPRSFVTSKKLPGQLCKNNKGMARALVLC